MTGPAPQGQVLAVSVGGIGTLDDGRRTLRTGFVKTPVEGPVELGPFGFPGDAHAYRHHGGADMAVCVYPAEHLATWRATGLDLPDIAAFGENLTTQGLVETDVCIGDVFGVDGGAVVQVSQPRAPCRKIAVRHGRPRLDLALTRAGHTGWLLRVLEPGPVTAGTTLRLVERPTGAVTVAEANRVLHLDRDDLVAAAEVLASPGLADAAAVVLRRRLEQAAIVQLRPPKR